jgi:hypothetical protein
MADPGVLVVLTNWRRPANLAACVVAWRDQSHPPARIVVVDNNPFHRPEPEAANWLDLGAADVWRINENLGPPCRFLPAVAHWDTPYVVFADDDLLPGREAIETCLRLIASRGDDFAVIGQEGRRFGRGDDGEYFYRYGNTPRAAHPVRVDTTVRCHFTETSLVLAALSLRASMTDPPPGRAAVGSRLARVHDDLLLNLGVQRLTGRPSYVLPLGTPEQQLIRDNLPGGNNGTAVWKRPEHLPERNLFVSLAAACGWHSLVESDPEKP